MGGSGSLIQDHDMHLWTDDAELEERTARYLAEGLDAGGSAVVLATAEHREGVAARLRQLGHDPAELRASGRLVERDAGEALAAIREGADVSAERFEAVAGAALDAAAAGPVHVFGELVDLLARDGDLAAAAQLEDLWNGLARRRRFSLLCGYRADLFDRDTQVALLPAVCERHARLLPPADEDRLGAAVDAALAETLGGDAHKVYALVAPESRRGRVPLPHLALMWVSANMPTLAARVLDTARRRYAGAPAS